MKFNGWRIFSLVCAVIGLALCILAVVKGGEQPFPLLGLFFANVGLWTNVILTQKEKQQHE